MPRSSLGYEKIVCEDIIFVDRHATQRQTVLQQLLAIAKALALHEKDRYSAEYQNALVLQI